AGSTVSNEGDPNFIQNGYLTVNTDGWVGATGLTFERSTAYNSKGSFQNFPYTETHKCCVKNPLKISVSGHVP
ncbi:hypothetical protein KKG19_05280, partial [Patescibacteria group bacterium]|nr:hypothetical protein [Patescibacteria group bacterium]